MKVTLIIESGEFAGRRIGVPLGQEFRVGRDAPCEIRVPSDSMMSNPHFVLQLEGSAVRVRDRSKFGTMLNGGKITECELKDGDRIVAGRTEFRILVSHADGEVIASPPPATPATAPTVPHGSSTADTDEKGLNLLTFFQAFTNLFAILDSAREPTIPSRLSELECEFQSLYEGPDMLEIQCYGPWLVKLPTNSSLLPALVKEGWGNSWGVYFSSDAPFSEVRHHLRRFLTVVLPENRAALFRFYDPRVLRVYLPTCTVDEKKSFFGPVRGYYCEGEKAGQLCMFAPTQNGASHLQVV